MSLTHLHIRQFRNISEAELAPHPRINLICGANGAGKTSVLEAVSLLGRGRSFRSHKLKPLIQQDAANLVVFGRLTTGGQQQRIGIERNRSADQDQFRIDGERVSSAADLAQLLPLQTIFSDTFALLTGGPGERRQFLDWLVFHVKHDFYETWRQGQQALKQRNSLLRSGRIAAEILAPWTHLLCQQAERLDQLRAEVFALFLVEFRQLSEEVQIFRGLSMDYLRGWPSEQSLADVLVQQLPRDSQLGYTQQGPQRADLRFRLGRQPAQDILSRGQQKLLVCALRVCAARVFKQATGKSCLFLVDDLPAELDLAYRGLLIQWLSALECQVFITGVSRQDLLAGWEQLNLPYKMFHVEQGKVSEQ